MDIAPSALAGPPRAAAGRARPRGPGLALYRGDGAALARRAGVIVTPNLDHLRMLACSRAFRRVYAAADVRVNDSRFLDRLALRGRVACLPGSELAPGLLGALAEGSRVVVIGCNPAVVDHLGAAYPRLGFEFANPSMGYVARRGERRWLVQQVLAADPHCVFVCTGAPSSELLAAQIKRAGCGATILCCGSAFNFLAGVKRRAPRLFRRLGAEWLWRFVHEGRTRGRYLADAAFLLANLGAFLTLRRGGEARFARFALRA